MNEIQFSDINLLDIGIKIAIAGVIWNGDGKSFVTLLPGVTVSDVNESDIRLLKMDLDQWKQFMRQSDLLETEIFRDDGTGMKKSLFRKTARQIDTRMSWSVYERDNYSCRYCGRRGIPLTVDHIILWEEGGATIPENLLTACSPCNRDRGNRQYDDWLKSPKYLRVSVNLTDLTRKANEDIVGQLPYLRTLTKTVIKSR